ncbi:procathepsin L-like [Cydia pomonella]|uniref:procathepsin L-like n=1 Tax=Cydia pomonella TaxID=82600 RepID=UPI002ADE4E38|nr:procathepsin L-like [Cydia pomonella]
MLVSTVWVAACLASSAVMAVSHLDKPYYDLNDAENLFKDFIKQHGKVYNGREYSERLEIFKESLKDINSRNEKYPQTVFKVNHFSDLTPEELELYRGVVPVRNVSKAIPYRTNTLSRLPEFDWRKVGVITPVKNQGKCGCGYIFSAIGTMEGRYAMKYRECLAFSESQALDCYENAGCNGGNPWQIIWGYMFSKCGVILEKDYPYQPEKQTCRQNKSMAVTHVLPVITGWGVSEEELLLEFLVNIGPLAICLSAADFKHYSGGILEPDLCTGKPFDHCVLLVGYGEENGKQFWTIKNSYGVMWGERGYVRIRRGVKACGITGKDFFLYFAEML